MYSTVMLKKKRYCRPCRSVYGPLVLKIRLKAQNFQGINLLNTCMVRCSSAVIIALTFFKKNFGKNIFLFLFYFLSEFLNHLMIGLKMVIITENKEI